MRQAALTRAKLEAAPAIVIDAERIARSGLLMRQRMDTGDVSAKQAYIASVVSGIKVRDDRVRDDRVRDDRVRDIGQKNTLRQAVADDLDRGGSVLDSVPEWRARRDSNS